MTPFPHKPSRPPAAGDIVVTKVVEHYHIGRLQHDRASIAAITVIDRRGDALVIACQVATGSQRVFLYDRAGTKERKEIDRAKATDDH